MPTPGSVSSPCATRPSRRLRPGGGRRSTSTPSPWPPARTRPTPPRPAATGGGAPVRSRVHPPSRPPVVRPGAPTPVGVTLAPLPSGVPDRGGPTSGRSGQSTWPGGWLTTRWAPSRTRETVSTLVPRCVGGPRGQVEPGVHDPPLAGHRRVAHVHACTRCAPSRRRCGWGDRSAEGPRPIGRTPVARAPGGTRPLRPAGRTRRRRRSPRCPRPVRSTRRSAARGCSPCATGGRRSPRRRRWA